MNEQETSSAETRADPEKIALAKEALGHLDKMIKTTALFGAGHMNVERSREEFEAGLGTFLDNWGRLRLDLEGGRILVDGVAVADDEAQKHDCFFRLFQDGVSALIIEPGIGADEIDGLLSILLAVFTGPLAHDDTVTVYWDAAPDKYRFVASPDIADSGEDSDPGGAEGGKTYRETRMALAGRDVAGGGGAARVDSELALQAAQVSRMVVDGVLAPTAVERERVAGEDAAGEPALVEKYVEVLLRVLARSGDERHRGRLLEVTRRLFAGMAEGRDLDRAARLLHRLRSLAATDGVPAVDVEAALRVLDAVAGPELVARVMRSLTPRDRAGAADPTEVEGALRFLELLGDEALGPMLEDIGLVTEPKTRRALCALMAGKGAARVGMFRERLARGEEDIAADLLRILAAIGTAEAFEAMLPALRASRADVRLLALQHLGESSTPALLEALSGLLDDGQERIRALALQRLEQSGGVDVARRFRTLIRDKGFAFRDKEEKRRIFAALGRVAGRDALTFFRECFETKNPLKRQAIDELRGCGAYMLGVLGDRESRAALERGARGRLTSPFYKWACAQALAMLDGEGRTSLPPGG